MLQTGKALKVSIYVSEGSTHHGFAAAAELLDFLFYRGVAGATVLKGVAGFGADHHLHTASSVEISDRLPIKVEFIETPEKVHELMGKLQELAGSGIIEVQETTIVKAAAPLEESPATVARRTLAGKAKLLRIYVDEAAQWNEKPLHEALVQALRANEMAGVTAYRSTLAFRGEGELHKQHTFGDGASLMLSTIDTAERIAAFMPVLERMLADGLVVLSDVDTVSYRSSTESHPSQEVGRGEGAL